ncbi:hypothetical protein ABZT03_22925 [Streptomyces sp. NPDC005574]|uniref:hypothetical protein n=1 Tax=Streptomyces sp. NPDC005574 TaxID=3156891 RepID=UPI0033B67482
MLSVLEVFPVRDPHTRVCVVRCIEGTAALGMEFLVVFPGEERVEDPPRSRLEKIEWYGKSVEQLDTVHSGKVTLLGYSAELLAPGSMLNHFQVDDQVDAGALTV